MPLQLIIQKKGRALSLRSQENVNEGIRIWSNRNSHLLLVGMQNGTATLQDSLVVFNKTKHTTKSSNDAPWYLPKGAENLRGYL